MWPTRVTVAGVDVALDDTLAELVIRTGRGSVDDGATASTIQLVVQDVTRAYSRDFVVGVPIAVRAGVPGQPDAPRFTGTVTDAALDGELLTLIGAGVLATLERYPVGGVDWPAEKWSTRVIRAFDEAGVPELLELQSDPAFDPLLVARTADETDLYSYLGELAVDVSAAITDTPAGHVLVQQISARGAAAGTGGRVLSWAAVPAFTTWADVDPETSWSEATSLHALDPDTYPDFDAILDVDPDDVLFVPVWTQRLELENETTVGYGANLETTVVEPTSLDRFGPYPGGVSTQIDGLADATERATQRVTRRAFPRWVIDSATLLVAHHLFTGELVRLSGFPASSPAPRWDGVLEGWLDTIRGDDWTLELALSDPQYSGLALTWLQVPADVAWSEVDPSTSWLEATTLGALNPT